MRAAARYHLTGVPIVKGVELKHLHKLEETATSLLVVTPSATSNAITWAKSNIPSTNNTTATATPTNRGNTTVNLRGVKLPGLDASVARGVGRVAVGAGAVAVGALAFNHIGTKVTEMDLQTKQIGFLRECAGGLRVASQSATTDTEAEVAKAYHSVAESALYVLERNAKSSRDTLLIAGGVASSAVLGGVGAALALPAVMGMGAVGAIATIFTWAYRAGGNSLRNNVKQGKHLERLREDLQRLDEVKRMTVVDTTIVNEKN